MIDREMVHQLRTELGELQPPVLSLYVEVNPAQPENERRAWELRARNAVKALGAPTEIEEAVLAALEAEIAPEARTLALFAASPVAERKSATVAITRLPLHISLPLLDLTNGRVEARWGDPYIAPLIYALDQYERTAVVWLRGEGWRFFEVFLGEIVEHTDVFRSVEADLWREVAQFDPNRLREQLRAQAMGNRDRFARRMENIATRYLQRLAGLTERALSHFGIRRLILLGREEATKQFADLLPRTVQAMIVAHVADLPHPEASPAHVLAKVLPALAQAEQDHEQRLLEQIARQPGIWGIDPTLTALQEGRLSVLVAPWRLDAQVWMSGAGLLAASREQAALLAPDSEPQPVALRDVIVDLCAAFATRLEFVAGPAEDRLLRDFSGLAGLLRW
ncbi:VLRF1 family aeRF1-type release factor [Chloroflexus sp.]|uniref:VLRF1 family aeRF1-type release factor n=1 Tax=Chloroflexus sp. TaxID=1904827 RepID=UPI00262ABA2D|nr:VLRF1 family aeRF1-type release factor [uncultured Chloroflexus sp.]